MTAVVGGGDLPRGWADLGRQLVIWFGFALAVPARARSRRPQTPRGVHNGHRVVDIETQSRTALRADLPAVRRPAALLATAVSWTYWNSEFTVVGLDAALGLPAPPRAFTALPEHDPAREHVGLVGYVFVPTAPPRLLGARLRRLTHRDGLVQLAANPYAAMPSLHAADALIVGVVLALRLQALVGEGLLGRSGPPGSGSP